MKLLGSCRENACSTGAQYLYATVEVEGREPEKVQVPFIVVDSVEG